MSTISFPSLARKRAPRRHTHCWWLLGILLSSVVRVLCSGRGLHQRAMAAGFLGSVLSLRGSTYLDMLQETKPAPYNLTPSSPPSSEQQAATSGRLPNRLLYVSLLLVAPCTRALAPATPCTRNNRFRRTKNLTCCGGGLGSNAGRNSRTVDQTSC